jgi:hypothetical protein
MEKVEDPLKGLKLSEMENKWLQIGGSEGKKEGLTEPKAIAKLLSYKPGHAEAMAMALGWFGCLMKGATNVGENVFTFFCKSMVRTKH